MNSKHCIEWIESKLRCSNRIAEFRAKPVKLFKWQKDFLKDFFNRPDLEQVLICSGRKTGKTEFIGYIILYFMFFKEAFCHIHCADSGRQTDYLKNMLREILTFSKLPLRYYKQECFIINPKNENKIFFKVANLKIQGETISSFSCDESDKLQPEVLNLLRGSIPQGGLEIFLTNPPDSSLSWICPLIDKARKNPRGKRHLLLVYENRKTADINSVETWKRANPSYGKIVNERFYKKEIENCKGIPALMESFKRLYLGIHNFSTAERWLSSSLIQPCNLSETELKKLYWYCALDCSTSKDLCSFVMLAEHNNNTIIKNYNWLPQASLSEREFKNKKLIQRFLLNKDNDFFISQGEVLDLKEVSDKIIEITEGYTADYLALDRTRKGLFPEDLKNYFQLFDFSQGKLHFSPLIFQLENIILRKRLQLVNMNPVWLWAFENVRLQHPLKTPARTFYRKHSKDAIDPVVATGMALGLSMKFNIKDQAEPSVYRP